MESPHFRHFRKRFICSFISFTLTRQLITAFSLTLGTIAFDYSTLEWFGASTIICTAYPSSNNYATCRLRGAQSSEHLTNLCPLRVSSLSSSFSIALLSNELVGPPWDIPVSIFSNIPLLMTTSLRYLCISDIALPSTMVFDNISGNLFWHTISKNFSISMPTTFTYPSSAFC
jgi:hypothetical protein